MHAKLGIIGFPASQRQLQGHCITAGAGEGFLHTPVHGPPARSNGASPVWARQYFKSWRTSHGL